MKTGFFLNRNIWGLRVRPVTIRGGPQPRSLPPEFNDFWDAVAFQGGRSDQFEAQHGGGFRE
jgi:hypothetical protein